MRAFRDQGGKRWDAVVGHESYGIQVLLFMPEGDGETRKAVMAATTRLEAHREVDALTEAELRQRLARSQPWDSDTRFSG